MDPETIIALTTVGTILFTVCASLCITVAAVAPIVLIFWWIFRRGKEIRQKSAQATPAKATIVSAQSFSSENTSRLNVELVLEVAPPFGPVYRATTNWAVDYLAAPQLQIGQTVPVRIDATNKALIFPDVPWANYTDSRIIRLGS